MSNSELEDLFAQQLDALGLTGYLREYPAVKGRKFRWDFCWKSARLLVEIMAGLLRKVRILLARGLGGIMRKTTLRNLRAGVV